MAKKKSSFTKLELQNLRKSLPITWKEDLAKKHGFAEGTVKNIMYGLGVNDEVIFSALDLAVEHKKYIESQKSLLGTL